MSASDSKIDNVCESQIDDDFHSLVETRVDKWMKDYDNYVQMYMATRDRQIRRMLTREEYRKEMQMIVEQSFHYYYDS